MLNRETLQNIYNDNCEYLTSLNKDELLDMCQNLARLEFSLLLDDSNVENFNKTYDFTIKESNGLIIEISWIWANKIRVIINPVDVMIDFRNTDWQRASKFKTSFLYCFN